MAEIEYPDIAWPERHRTQLWLYLGLVRLRDDLQPEQAPPEQVAALNAAIAMVKPIAGIFMRQGDLDQRYLALTGALRSAAEIVARRPMDLVRERGLPEMEGFLDTLSGIDLSVGATFRKPAAQKFKGLYVIIDPELTAGRDPVTVAEAVLKGGATAIQYRDKRNDKGDSIDTARALMELCTRHDAVCIINDHADLAVAIQSHGVHVGQHDLSIPATRTVMKSWQMLGKSNALLEEAVASYEQGADYIAVGAMFGSTSKDNTRPAGPETLKAVRKAIPADGPPLVAIGGITTANVGQLAQAGADGVCVISAVAMADNPERATSELLAAFQKGK
jgi:thiamine-phosphate pyrophosphorylase